MEHAKSDLTHLVECAWCHEPMYVATAAPARDTKMYCRACWEAHRREISASPIAAAPRAKSPRPEAIRGHLEKPRKLTREEKRAHDNLERSLALRPGDARVRPTLGDPEAPGFWHSVDERTIAGDYVVPVDVKQYVREKEEQRERLVKAREVLDKKRPKKKRTPKAMKSWIERRARQFNDNGERYGARYIWEELCKDIANGVWTGVASFEAAPTYVETRKIVNDVRGKKAP